MFRVVTNAVYHLIGLDLARADTMDGGEEGELVFHVLGLQHMVDLFSRDWTLKSTVQMKSFDLP